MFNDDCETKSSFKFFYFINEKEIRKANSCMKQNKKIKDTKIKMGQPYGGEGTNL